MQSERSHKLIALDALRGVAALAVLAYHHTRSQICPHGYLAVDFFFMLSGFVMCYAYQGPLDKGWKTGQFLLTRLARLYPLYLLGLLVGLLMLAVHLDPAEPHPSTQRVWIVLVTGLLFVPDPRGIRAGGTQLYPVNGPAWSIFFELAANVIHATFLRRRSTGFLMALAGVCGVAFALEALRLGMTDLGPRFGELFPGLLRVVFCYVTGMLIFRLWRSRRIGLQVPVPVLAIALPALLAAPVVGRFAQTYDLVVLFLIFPVLLLLASQATTPAWLTRAALQLGAASYAIYILHLPILGWMSVLGDRAPWIRAHLRPPWGGVVFSLATVALAFLADGVYDGPARAWLKSRLVRRKEEPRVA